MTKTAAWKRLVMQFRPRTGALAGLAALAAALLLIATPAPARTTAAHISETATPEVRAAEQRRRRPGRPNPRREQPAAAAPAEAAAPTQTTPPARPPGLCDVRWHETNRGGAAVAAAVAGGADVNQACGSGSSPLLLALEVGRADVVLALIRAGASLDYRDPYTRKTANQEINDRCDAGQLAPVCAEVRRGFEARAEAHNNLCDPRWWRSFYRQSEAQATSRMQAVLRTPGLDVNYDCGRGDRPLHIALQDSLTPLTDGAYWAIGTFMYEADNLDLFARNRSGRSPMDLAEVRYDHQVRGNYRRLLSRYCNNQVTREEYRRQYNQIYANEAGVYTYMKGYESDQAYRAANVAFNQEMFGTTHTGSKTDDQLCLKSR